MSFLKDFKPIKISKPAETDLKNIADYTLREWGKLQKKNYLGMFKQSFLTLSQSPIDNNIMHLGRIREDIVNKLFSYRIKKHVVYFRETEHEFLIVRVLHSRMDPEKNLYDKF